MPDPDQTGWLIIHLIAGIIGFAACSYVQIGLAGGKRFKEQARDRKLLIVCTSTAQWPYLFFACYAGFHLLVGMIS